MQLILKRRRLLRHVQELHIEDEGGAAGDLTGHSLSAVAHVGGDGELGPLALGHLSHSLVPAGDHLLPANVELEGAAPVPAAVDLLAILEGEDVVARDLLPGLGEGGAVTGLKSLNVDAHVASLQKVMERSGLRFEHFCLEVVLN